MQWGGGGGGGGVQGHNCHNIHYWKKLTIVVMKIIIDT